MTKVNAQIEEKKTELDDAKQEVNKVIRSERLKEIANSKDLRWATKISARVNEKQWKEKKIIRYTVRNRKSQKKTAEE